MTEGPEDRSFVSAFDADQRDQPRDSPRQSSLLGHFGHDIDIFIRTGRLFSDSAIGPGAYQHAPFPQFLNQLAPLPLLAGLSSAQETSTTIATGINAPCVSLPAEMSCDLRHTAPSSQSYRIGVPQAT